MSQVVFERVQPGDRLPPLSVHVSASVIVAGATASGDFEVVHHDVKGAQARGTPDIFMNILTSNGYVQRFVNDWLAPQGRIRSIDIRLGVPTFAGDTLHFAGVVKGKDESQRTLEIEVTGTNGLGQHVLASVQVALP
ncbi:MAG: acyl dehydratase [Proteobacteria bacterium]|nr:acyl dehydratase [Pseudomonadota bacterium]